MNVSEEKLIEEIKKVVEEQANDEGLWCDAMYASEAYIQQALRRLHEVIEQKTSEECAVNAESQVNPNEH